MVSGYFHKAGLACAAVALLAGSASAVRADNLFDMLFGGNRAARGAPIEQQQRRVAPPAQRKPVALPKVSAPSYYNYQPASLVRVDFSQIAPSPEASEAEAETRVVKGDPAFQSALTGLAGFELYAEKDIAEALAGYYTRHPGFIWVDQDRPNAAAQSALRVLAEAGRYGLSEADYSVRFPSADGSSAGQAERQRSLIRFEMMLSARALRYARDAYSGRVDPNKLSGYHDFPKKSMDLVQSLGFMAHASDVDLYLQGLHPRNDEYRALRAELETLRAAAEKEIVVDPKTFVRPGGSHPEFAKLLKIMKRDGDTAFLETYGALLDGHAGSEVYDEELVPVVKAAQERHGLKPDGVIGPRTVSAVAGETKAARIEKVLFALERLRWHPSKLGDTRVVINAAAFEVDYFEDGKPRLSMRTVVGSASNQTSFFHDKLEFVEFNPYWGVPRSILVNEMLPKLVRDPSYLDRNGYEVVNSRGQRVSSTSVSWGQHGGKVPVSVRQKPGPSNALGELKILFPNRHAIYMHDTPSKSLFQRDTRAFSHGCVRLADPRAMAAAVLGTSVDDVAASINSGDRSRPTRRKIDRDIPVYVGYFTAWPEAATGRIGYHGDVYGRDERLKIALEKIADLRAASS
ncbi:murein L,D-transpeptidase [Nitratireductor sp. ZSWI3]|uniref:L,D-transpeptidase family protein n=1 Tax=Nitratireductor sp. ZSWI3 TaxID=2966359 RepID=UPI00214F8C6A|nr:L,D-transpeptidase family protein [Nitratireductor sp. ZSWI3]MCR4266688.1 L,D-transpeptidase family protein [Nitratireductor sp. ZSWI3]